MKKNTAAFNTLFPLAPQKALSEALYSMYSQVHTTEKARINRTQDKSAYQKLVTTFGIAPVKTPTNPQDVANTIIGDIFDGAVNWRSPNLLYNVGASVNVFTSAAYATSLDINVYNINDGLAGNALAAERAVIEILARLAKVPVETSAGLFTFGGTATNLYGMKLGLTKALPETRANGLTDQKIKAFISEDAHFSHMRAADWLGIGSNNVIALKADMQSRQTLLAEATNQIEKAIEEGYTVPIIIINGGTTYSQTIDDIAGFVSMRNQLVKKYNLSYSPHIHVDSVIGWCWLVFSEYDFQKNELEIEPKTLQKIEKQYNKISEIRLCDSWGVDFHKGIGGCPIDSSVFMINQLSDVSYLSRKLDPNVQIHQLATEFSHTSPVEYTLETSRAAGASLSALMMFHTEGLNGVRIHLATLIEEVGYLGDALQSLADVSVVNSDNHGFVLMVRMYPPNLDKSLLDQEILGVSEEASKTIDSVNEYLKSFFTFDLKSRMAENTSFEYSFSSSYQTTACGKALSALKFYPTSPHFGRKHVVEIVKTLKKQKSLFDEWYLSHA